MPWLASSGRSRSILVDKDEAWVDVGDDLQMVEGGRAFTWTTERDGWRHAYRVSLFGGKARLITNFEGDVIDEVSVDEEGG